MINNKKAFSLVEIMVSLVVVSMLVAAFAPVITKRLSRQTISISKGSAISSLTSDCAENFSSDCKLCEGATRCLMCMKDCEGYSGKDTKNCECFNCPDKGINNCLECDTNGCKKCEEGYGTDKLSGNCAQCQIGQYSDGTKECKICPQGEYTDSCAQKQCKTCEKGYKCSNGIKTACEEGTYQDEEGKSECKLCPKGTSNNQTGQISCSTCLTGYYQDKEGQLTCKQCADGEYTDSTTDKLSCKTCKKGSMCIAGIKQSCTSTTYQDETGQSSCKTCSSKTPNCSRCNSTTGVCSACTSPYTLSGTSCVQNSGECNIYGVGKYRKSDNTFGYYQHDCLPNQFGSCNTASAGFAQQGYDYTCMYDCASTNQVLNLNATACIDACPQGYHQVYNETEGVYYNYCERTEGEVACKDDNCKTCDQTWNCTECMKGFTLHGGRCWIVADTEEYLYETGTCYAYPRQEGGYCTGPMTNFDRDPQQVCKDLGYDSLYSYGVSTPDCNNIGGSCVRPIGPISCKYRP